MNYSYELLSGSDVPLFQELLKAFGEAFEDPTTYQGAIPGDAYLRRLLEKEHFIAIVARNEGRVVGGLTAYVLEKFEQDRREIYIYDLAVLEGHRRRGVATKLIRELQGVGNSEEHT